MADENVVREGSVKGIRVVCRRCGYEWFYKGRLWFAICPRCRGMTPTGLGPKRKGGRSLKILSSRTRGEGKTFRYE